MKNRRVGLIWYTYNVHRTYINSHWFINPESSCSFLFLYLPILISFSEQRHLERERERQRAERQQQQNEWGEYWDSYRKIAFWINRISSSSVYCIRLVIILATSNSIFGHFEVSSSHAMPWLVIAYAICMYCFLARINRCNEKNK